MSFNFLSYRAKLYSVDEWYLFAMHFCKAGELYLLQKICLAFTRTSKRKIKYCKRLTACCWLWKNDPGFRNQIKQDLAVQHHQLRKQVQALQVSRHLHPLLRLWNMDSACRLWEKDPGFRNQVHEKSSPSTKPTTGCRVRSASSGAHRKLFWQLSRGVNLHGFGM